jgi:hypothetical protein
MVKRATTFFLNIHTYYLKLFFSNYDILKIFAHKETKNANGQANEHTCNIELTKFSKTKCDQYRN